jgi:hypothetical protein
LRSFRVDRTAQANVWPLSLRDETDKTLAAYLRSVRGQAR